MHSQQKPNTGSAPPDVADSQEAISDQLGKVVAVVKRFAGVGRLQAWWSVAYLAEAGWLTLGEWRAIAAIARRQGDNLEASPCAPPGWRPA